MKNRNYSILGKILGILNNDFPPYVSKTFSDNVMKNIHTNTDSQNFNYKNFLNIAASVFFAVVTAYGLMSFQQTENNIAAQENIEKENDLIKRVIDDSSCVKLENQDGKQNDECK
jgi:hypothetical protein